MDLVATANGLIIHQKNRYVTPFGQAVAVYCGFSSLTLAGLS